MIIGTHNGPFHADEALAVYMLRLLPEFRNALVLRSRDPVVWDKCDIVVDVSGKYEPPKFFDHHQRSFSTTFNEKFTTTKLSSAGLIYKHFGRRILSSVLDVPETSDVVSAIYERVYDSFVQAVDANDNGVSAHEEAGKFKTFGISLPAIVSRLNPLWSDEDDPAISDSAFQKASELMGLAFTGEVRHQGLSWFPSREIVKKAYEERKKYDELGRLLVFDRYVAWKDHVHEIEKDGEGKVVYVLYSTGDSFRVQAVSVSPNSFESRKPLPEAWRGLRDSELSEATGIDGCVFVHASGFVGGCNTFEGSLALARKALAK